MTEPATDEQIEEWEQKARLNTDGPLAFRDDRTLALIARIKADAEVAKAAGRVLQQQRDAFFERLSDAQMDASSIREKTIRECANVAWLNIREVDEANRALNAVLALLEPKP